MLTPDVTFTEEELKQLLAIAETLESEEDVRQLVEMAKCRKSIRYFVDTYVYIRTSKGIEKIVPYDWQYTIWDYLSTGHNTFVLKSRQVGVSWTGDIHAAWLSIFFQNKNTYFFSANGQKAKSLVQKAKVVFDHLPEWMRIACGYEPYSIQIKCTGTDSMIMSLSAGRNTGRGETADFILCDEMAFWPFDEMMWGGIAPMISTGGVALIVSTPPEPERGQTVYGDQLERVNKGISEGDPKYKNYRSIQIHYSQCRGRDEAWIQEQKAIIGNERMWNREYELVMGETGFPFFNIDKIQYKPELRDGAVADTTVCFTGIDTSEQKKDGDLSSIITVNQNGIMINWNHTKSMGLSAWAGLPDDRLDQTLPPEDRFGFVGQWILKHPGITVIEKNNHGILTFMLARRLHDGYKHTVIPYTTGTQSRPKLLDELSIDLDAGNIIVTDEYTYKCLMNFVQTDKGKPVAAFGWKDDPVFALALANQARRMGASHDMIASGSGQPRIFQESGLDEPQQYADPRERVATNAPVLGGTTRWTI